MEGILQVSEIYKSIQGESTYAGLPCVFVRLTGCSLRCSWCDTTHAFHGGSAMTIQQITQNISTYNTSLIEITGGEPLDQPEAIPLVKFLCDQGYDVLVETSGAIDITPLDSKAHIILDLKCPGSHMTSRMEWNNLMHLKPKDQVKFVILNRFDYEWALSIISKYALNDLCEILFAPVFGELDPKVLCEWVLGDSLQVRVQLQLHKFIWDSNAHGV